MVALPPGSNKKAAPIGKAPKPAEGANHPLSAWHAPVTCAISLAQTPNLILVEEIRYSLDFDEIRIEGQVT